MNVFLIGATGFIGSAVARELMARGHTVLGLAHSDKAAATLAGRGITPFRGDLTDVAALTAGARRADAVIHLGAVAGPNFPAVDALAVDALLAGLEGTGKPFLYTSGAAVAGDTGSGIGDEETSLDPASKSAWRGATERRAIDAVKRGIRAVAIRPCMVYGHGEGGFVRFFLSSAKRGGAALTVGDGHWRWSTVHVDDIADLYVRALERAEPGQVFLAASDEALSFQQMAEAASRAAGAGGKTAVWPAQEARATLGALVDLMTANTVVSGAKARRLLEWNPTGPRLLDDLNSGSYQMRPALVQSAEERKSVAVPGEIFTFLARGRDTGGAYALMQVTLGGEVGPPPHFHDAVEESFYVLTGEVTFTTGDHSVTVAAGGYVNIPKGTVHRFANATDKTAQIITLVVPAGMDDYFEEAGVPVAGPDAPMPTDKGLLKKLTELGPKYGVEFVHAKP